MNFVRDYDDLNMVETMIRKIITRNELAFVTCL